MNNLYQLTQKVLEDAGGSPRFGDFRSHLLKKLLVAKGGSPTQMDDEPSLWRKIAARVGVRMDSGATTWDSLSKITVGAKQDDSEWQLMNRLWQNGFIAGSPIDLNPKPAAPSGLSATTVSDVSISLEWVDNAFNEHDFSLQRSLDNSAWTEIALLTHNTTDYVDTGLTAGTLYYYRVKAVNSSGSSSYSTDSATTEGVPDAPTWDALALVVNPTSVELHWNDLSDNETGFKVQKSTVSDTGPWTTVHTTAANIETYTVTGLTHNTVYWFQVLATNAVGDSASTGSVEITTDNEIPLAPSGLGHTAEAAPNKATFIWTDNSDNEGGFTIYGRDITAGEMALVYQADVFGPDITTLVDHLHNGTGFVALHNYEYSVRAWNDVGESGDSGLYTFTYNLV